MGGLQVHRAGSTVVKLYPLSSPKDAEEFEREVRRRPCTNLGSFWVSVCKII